MERLPESRTIDLGSDSPKSDPIDDAYGYAPFAIRIANAIKFTPSPHGLVMAVNGAWGSGKSTILNFVKHNLESKGGGSEDESEAGQEIVVIDFNPWWFNDRNHLANQFLVQFQSALKLEKTGLRDVGDLIADYADALGATMATAAGMPAGGGIVSWFLKKLKRDIPDVPKLKEKVAEALRLSKKRFLFLIDDIDRLTPDEIREVFKVIKALADFPNVIYLLSFDRDVVAQALNNTLGLNGDAYLEKIVQVPFTLPAVDKLRLRSHLFKNLDRLLTSCPGHRFDQEYWQNMYFDGLDHFIRKPRDVVRVSNALFVTYPGVAGEVNSVDYIALECLRIFSPTAYVSIRDSRDMFIDHDTDNHRDERDPLRVFHNGWLSKISEPDREAVRSLVSRMFPKAAMIWGGSGHGSEWNAIWRRELRVCSGSLFDVYFQFGVAPDGLSRAELNDLVSSALVPETAARILSEASAVIRPDGHSKARDYVDRIRDLDEELTVPVANGLLTALFAVADRLLVHGDSGSEMMSAPNHWRLGWLVKHLLGHIPGEDRFLATRMLISNGAAIGLCVSTIGKIKNHLDKPNEDSSSPYVSFSQTEFEDLKTIMIDRLSRISSADFLSYDDLAMIVYIWSDWGGDAEVRIKMEPLFSSDAFLPVVLEKFKQKETSQTLGNPAITRTIWINPRSLESITDIFALEPRVAGMIGRSDLTEEQNAVARSFIMNIERIRKGQNPVSRVND